MTKVPNKSKNTEKNRGIKTEKSSGLPKPGGWVYLIR
jgi:hypothetical protein